uniref:DUF6598 domain-containing protein n=1 Tax=Aegilops tauschii TaxID=37682 RepID=M8CVU4_AEGTA
MLGETQLPVPVQIGRKRRWNKDAAAAAASDEEASDVSPKEEQAPMDIAASPTGDKEEEEEMGVLACEMGEHPPTEIGSSSIASDVEEEEVTEEPEIPMWDSDDDGGVMRMTKAELQELHIACVKGFTELDPRKNLWVHTRFCSFNIGGFDLDRESKFGLGPPLYDNLTPKLERCMVSFAVNVISIKVTESDRGYPISLYGTVVARDTIDYRCVYLFRRAREDPQIINSKKRFLSFLLAITTIQKLNIVLDTLMFAKMDDMLTLIGPRRGLVQLDNIYFELNLRVKGDAGDEDFSKGVVVLHVGPYDPEPITRVLSSWLSRVELVLATVESPVAASLEVKVLKGAAPFSGKICAGTSENPRTQMIVYDSRDTKSGSSVVLTRNLVAVPDPDDDEDEIGAYVRFLDDGDDVDDEDAGTLVKLAYPAEEQVCCHSAWELQVKVSWTAILCKPMAKHVLTRGTSMPKDYTCPRYAPRF